MSAEAAEDFVLSQRILRLAPPQRWEVVWSLRNEEARELLTRWSFWAHPGQAAPDGGWRVWLIQAGRGFGKTRAGAEWVSAVARTVPDASIALVGATKDEVRKVMIEGPSGIFAVARAGERLTYKHTIGELHFSSGAVAHVYSANAPESLRGGEHVAAWCDELAKWRYPAAWDNLVLGLRGKSEHWGERSGEQGGEQWGGQRVMVTTTPRTNDVMLKVKRAKGLVETIGGTRANPHLSPAFLDAMLADYGGTRLGRQELDGELLDDVEGALWTRDMLEACRVTRAPELVRVVVGVDPPASATGDACGIVACGIDADGVGYVLEDASIAGASPEGWARAVAACAARWGADRVVAEKNNGGDMVRAVLGAADAGLPIKLVHASRGKAARAEPVAAKYERGEVRHAGSFAALEDELAGFTTGGGYAGAGSPDRADACVRALTELMLGGKRTARVRGLLG